MGKGDVGKACIGIDKEEVVALGFLGELMASPRFSDPSCGKWFTGDQSDPGIPLGSLLDYMGRAIGRVVVEDKNFEDRIITIGKCAQARTKACLLIPGGDQDRDAGGRVTNRCDFRKSETFQVQKVVEGDPTEPSKYKNVKVINRDHLRTLAKGRERIKGYETSGGRSFMSFYTYNLKYINT